MRDCVKCGKVVDGDECVHCHWSESKNAYATSADQTWRQCASVVRGERCAHAGVVSSSTLGGSFFCWQHAPAFRQYAHGEACAPPMGFAALRAKLKPFDFTAEMERRAIQEEGAGPDSRL